MTGEPQLAPGVPAAAAARTPLLLLVGLAAAAPLSLQIFLPALPAIQASFQVASGTAQLVLSLSILANAFANLAYGPLSDRFGRRPVLLTGLIGFIAGSVISAAAPTIGILIAGRIIQAVGAAAGMVLARAIVRDIYERQDAARMIAYLTMAMVVAPMMAPTIGAFLTELFDWRAVFLFVAVFALILTVDSLRRLVETRPAGAGTDGWRRMLEGFWQLGRNAEFNAYMLQSSFGIAIFFSFIAGAPYFMITVLGRSPAEYGFYFIAVSAGFMAGNFLAARLSARVGLDRMIVIGSVLALLGTIVALVLLSAGLWHPLSLFAPMTLVACANGLTVPNALAGGISVKPLLAGTASGLTGFMQMFTAAVVSQLVGVLQNGTPYPMAIVMTLMALFALVGFVVPKRMAAQAAT